MGTALAFALQALQAIPAILATGQNVVDLVTHTTGALKSMQDEGRDPSAEEWAALNDKIAGLRAQLHS